MQEPKKYFWENEMPMSSQQLESTSPKNVRVVPVEPKVKSAKTCELSLCGVSAKAKTAKTADPTCYDVPASIGERPAQAV